MPRFPKDPFGRRMLGELLRLRAIGALPLVETAPGRQIWRYAFRVGGQRVSVDLDATVLEMRCYHHRDEVAMCAVPVELMDVLLGRRPVPSDVPTGEEGAIVAELRRIVGEWRDDNPRLYMQPPVKVGHPDNWNRA
jgi:hypothetical protein